MGKYNIPLNERITVGDLSERKALRKNLKCQSFQWFLDTIVGGRLPYHDLIGAGELRNPTHDLCIDKNDRTENMDHAVDMYTCHNDGGYQYWWMNKNRSVSILSSTLPFRIIVQAHLFFLQKKIALHALIRVLHD